MGELRIMGPEGDTKLIWDSGKEDEVDNARENFNRLTKKGYLAFSVKKDGEKGKQIHKFDSEAEKIILSPPVMGG